MVVAAGCSFDQQHELSAHVTRLADTVCLRVAAGDEAIPPDAERQFAKRMGATTVEIQSNHCAMVSHPDEVAKLIKTAAEAVTVPAEAVGV